MNLEGNLNATSKYFSLYPKTWGHYDVRSLLLILTPSEVTMASEENYNFERDFLLENFLGLICLLDRTHMVHWTYYITSSGSEKRIKLPIHDVTKEYKGVIPNCMGQDFSIFFYPWDSHKWAASTEVIPWPHRSETGVKQCLCCVSSKL